MENIDSDLIRGNIDTIILKTMLHEDKYGLDIIKEIETRSNGTYELKQPTLYSCLKRLENQKLIESYWVDSEIGGRRHYYKLTQKGRDFYNQKQDEWSKSKFIIDNLLSNFNSDEYRLVKKDDYDKIIENKNFEYQEDSSANGVVETEDSGDTYESESDSDNSVENESSDADGNDSENENDESESDELYGDGESGEVDESETNQVDEETESESAGKDFDENQNKYNYQTSSAFEQSPTRKYYIDNVEDDDENASQMHFDEYSNSDDSSESKSDNEFENDNGYDGDEIKGDEEFPQDETQDDELQDEPQDKNDEQSETESDYDDEYDGGASLGSYTTNSISKTYSNIDLKWDKDEDDQSGDDGEDFGDESENQENADETYENESAENYSENSYEQQSFDSNTDENDEFSNKLNRFSSVAKELQDFDSSGETTAKSEDIDEDEPESKPITLLDYDDNFKFSDSDTTLIDSYKKNEDVDYDDSFEGLEQEDYQQSENSYYEQSNQTDETSIDYDSYLSYNEDDETQDDDSKDDDNDDDIDDDFFDDLGGIGKKRQSSFLNSSDNVGYDDNPPPSSDDTNLKAQESTVSEETEVNEYDYENQSESDNKIYNLNAEESYNNISNYDNYDEFDNTSSEETTTTQNDSFQSFDDIISQNASSYSQATMFDQTNDQPAFTPQYTSDEYKQKLSNLSEYSNAGLDETKISTQTNENGLSKAKDIETLKDEFSQQGIHVKEFKRYNANDTERSFVLINKLNLVASAILLFGYMFFLSAVYIILNSTSLQNMPNFSFLYFLYGFIPFAVFALYHLVKFLINPYKKVPAKYSVAITMFIAVIVTVQLILITYCVNLQLGFYSFTQLEYNHLLWIIPLIISFAPIILNSIFVALFHSKNFTV